MSFSNTKTPLKPKAKPKYVLPIEGPYHKQVLEGKNKEEFIRLFPITMNPDMMRLFGMCHSTLHRFANDETERCPRFEQNCIADGFYVEHIRYKGL